MHGKIDRGKEGQLLVSEWAIRNNFDIAIPFGQMPTDLILISKQTGKKTSVQIKSVWPKTDGCITFRLWKRNKQSYQVKDCDVIVGVDLKNKNMYVFEPKTFLKRKKITLRISGTVNVVQNDGNIYKLEQYVTQLHHSN